MDTEATLKGPFGHPNLISSGWEITIEPDGTSRREFVAYTNLELNTGAPGYDAQAEENLLGMLRDFMRRYGNGLLPTIRLRQEKSVSR